MVFLLQVPLSYSGTVYYLAPVEVFGTAGITSKYVTPQQVDKGDKVDIAQALSTEPGIYTLAKGPAAYDIILNGLNRDNINVLIDGAKVYGGCPSRMDSPIFHIPTNAIQVIKITYGPFDVRHAGSLGGLVEINTISPKLGTHANIALGLNSYSFFNPNIEASYNNGQYYTVLGYSFKTAKPYKDGNGTRLTDYIKNEYKSDRPSRAYNIYSYFGKLGFTPNEDSEIAISYLKQDAEKVLYPFLAMDAVYDRTNIVTFDAKRDNLGKTLQNVHLKLYYTDVYHLMTNEYRNAPMFASVFAETHVLGGRFSTTISGFTLGIGAFERKWFVEKTNIFKAQYMIPDVKIKNVGIFAKKSFPLASKLALEIGARVDTTKSIPDNGLQNEDSQQFPMYFKAYRMFYNADPRDSKRDTYASGYARLTYKLTPSSKFYIGFGHSVRTPDPEERYLCLLKPGKLWIGNPTLKPVKNNELDAGITGSLGKFRLLLNAFYRYIRDYITLTKVKKDTMLYVLYQNTNAHMYGADVSLSYDILKELTFTSKTTYLGGRQKTNDSKYIRSKHLPDIVPLREILSLKYHTPMYYVEIEGVLSARQNKVNTDIAEQKTPGFGIINLRCGVKYHRFAISAGVDNLLDHQYLTYTDYYSNPFNVGVKLPAPGRTFYANISYRF